MRSRTSQGIQYERAWTCIDICWGKPPKASITGTLVEWLTRGEEDLQCMHAWKKDAKEKTRVSHALRVKGRHGLVTLQCKQSMVRIVEAWSGPIIGRARSCDIHLGVGGEVEGASWERVVGRPLDSTRLE